jgi:hypothetical protein
MDFKELGRGLSTARPTQGATGMALDAIYLDKSRPLEKK